MNWDYSQGIADDRDDFFTALTTFLTNNGWVLHDDQSGEATPYQVYSSDGEDIDDETQYIRLTKSDTNVINLLSYRFWDNTTQTGYGVVGTTVTTVGIITSSDPFTYFLFGNKDVIHSVTAIAGTYRWRVFGRGQNFYDWQREHSTSSVSAGSDVVIPVTDTDMFEVGQRYTIGNTNDADGHWENFEVTAIDAVGNEITADELSNAHASGAAVGQRPLEPFVSTNTSTGTQGHHQYSATFSSISGSNVDRSRLSGDNTLPDALKGKYWLWPALFSNANGVPPLEVFGLWSIGSTHSIGALDSEDEIEVNGWVYKVFKAHRPFGGTDSSLAIFKEETT